MAGRIQEIIESGKAPGFLQETDVAGVEQVKTAVGKDHFFAAPGEPSDLDEHALVAERFRRS